MACTSRDIARLAGVSQATVSRVLHGKDNVTASTRARVIQVLNETGFVPNHNARAMRTRRSGSIGVVTGRLTNPFYPELIAVLADAIERADMRMTLWSSDGHSGEASAVAAIQGATVDGLIFTTVSESSASLKHALALNLPIVLANRTIEGVLCDQVSSDNFSGGSAVARYFLDNGHTNVAVVGGNGFEVVSTGRDRRLGFLAQFHERGLDISPERQPNCDFDHDAGRVVGLALLSLPNRPTAIFCVNDVIAFGVLDAALKLGIDCPRDLWVAGYDDIAMAAWDRLDLTTVKQPVADIADVAVDLLMRRIEKSESPIVKRLFDAELIVRGSTGGFDAAAPQPVLKSNIRKDESGNG